MSARTWELVHETYPVEKLASHAMCDQLQQLDRQCRLTNLCLGTVENYNGPLSFNHIINAIEYIIITEYEILRMDIK